MMEQNMFEDVESVKLPEGLQKLTDGYLEYAYEVIVDRALPAIDGLKPSQRRILVTMNDIEKVKQFTKCATICGSCMKLHPHGDTSIYETLCRMTDVSEVLSVPLIKGKGKFRKVYSEEPSAAMRYTECDFMPISKEYFRDMSGVDKLWNFDNTREEPEILPVSFPSILCNPTAGIAVGIASNIVPFNFHDVLEATINVIKTGRIGKVLTPDFTTGGEYVYDEDELKKLMKKGKGKIKLRGKWRVEGKSIYIDEIPYYTTIQRIMKVAKNIPNVAEAKDLTGLRNGRTVMGLLIECKNKDSVSGVLNTLLKESDLQMTVTSNLAVIINDEPKKLGVEELLQEWVVFRKKVLKKKYTLQLESLKSDIKKYDVFVALLTDEAFRTKFVQTLPKGVSAARAVLYEKFANLPDYIVDWILDMKLRAFADASKAIKTLESLKAAKQETEVALSDIGAVIIKQLENLSLTYSFPRRTTVTSVDYTFEEEQPEAFKCVVKIEDKFVRKFTENRINENDSGIHCMSDATVLLIDSKGRLLRLYIDNIPLTSAGGRGLYIPNYCELPDDFEIIDSMVVEPVVYNYVYSDGFVSSLNLAEWVGGQRRVKCTQNGISSAANLIMARFNPTDEYLYICTNLGRFCFVKNDFKVKNRTARTRLVNVKDGEHITYSKGITALMMMNAIPNYTKYMGKLRYLDRADTFNSGAITGIVTETTEVKEETEEESVAVV